MRPNDIVEVLYGTETYLWNCPGYCKYHKKYLTVRQIKQKHCLGKQCKCLNKLDHKFWEQRERKKQRKLNNVQAVYYFRQPFYWI